jgi:hypothetical protein
MRARQAVKRLVAFHLRGLRFWLAPPPAAVLDRIADEAKRKRDPLARLGVLLVRRRAERQQCTERLGPARATSPKAPANHQDGRARARPSARAP